MHTPPQFCCNLICFVREFLSIPFVSEACSWPNITQNRAGELYTILTTCINGRGGHMHSTLGPHRWTCTKWSVLFSCPLSFAGFLCNSVRCGPLSHMHNCMYGHLSQRGTSNMRGDMDSGVCGYFFVRLSHTIHAASLLPHSSFMRVWHLWCCCCSIVRHRLPHNTAFCDISAFRWSAT